MRDEAGGRNDVACLSLLRLRHCICLSFASSFFASLPKWSSSGADSKPDCDKQRQTEITPMEGIAMISEKARNMIAADNIRDNKGETQESRF